MARSLRFSFDFISPYAYLAWGRVHEFAARHRLQLEVEPVLFAAMLDAWGHKGPAEIPPKRLYTYKHAARLAADHGMPLQPPPAHPFNPLLGLRLASLPLSATEQRVIIDVLFTRAWAAGTGITDPAEVVRALEQAGLPGPALVEAAGADDNKQRLRDATDRAVARGLFGVPSMEVEGELFWGQDSFEHLARFLRGEDPVPADGLQRWEQLPSQSQRRALRGS